MKFNTLLLALLLVTYSFPFELRAASGNPLAKMRDISNYVSQISGSAARYTVWDGLPEDVRIKYGRYNRRSLRETYKLKLDQKMPLDEAIALAKDASIIFFADTHGVPSVQSRAEELFLQLAASTQRPKLFVAEFVYSKHQPELDAYMNGEITAQEFEELMLSDEFNDEVFAPDWWPPYAKLLEALRIAKIKVVAAYKIDGATVHWADIDQRDDFVVDLIDREFSAQPELQVYFLHGYTHLTGKNHLPTKLTNKKYGKTVRFLNALNPLHWQALERGFTLDKDLCIKLKDGIIDNTFYIHTDRPAMNDGWVIKSLSKFVVETKKELMSDIALRVVAKFNEFQKSVESDKRKSAMETLEEIKVLYKDWGTKILEPDTLIDANLRRSIRRPASRLKNL